MVEPGEPLLDARRRLERGATAAPAIFARPLHRLRPAGAEDTELETVWDGTKGRQGVSLTAGQGLGSSLAPGPGARVTR
jgi:hypothetical protein